MEVLPGPVFVRRALLLDSALRTEHAPIQDAGGSVVPCVEFKH